MKVTMRSTPRRFFHSSIAAKFNPPAFFLRHQIRYRLAVASDCHALARLGAAHQRHQLVLGFLDRDVLHGVFYSH